MPNTEDSSQYQMKDSTHGKQSPTWPPEQQPGNKKAK